MRTLVLHFDLNRTILMSDAAAGRNIRDALNYIVSDQVWGKMSGMRTEPDAMKWDPTSFAVTDTPPSKELDTYLHFLSEAYPYAEADAPVPTGFDSKAAFNKAQRGKRRVLERSFTCEGQVGHRFAGAVDDMEHALRIPEEAKARVASTLPALEPGALRDSWAAGYFYVLPSFFVLLRRVAGLLSQGADIRIVFRTFGTDLLHVSTELDLFCAGAHPIFPGAKCDGSDGSPDLRLQGPFAHIFRGGPTDTDVLLVDGTLDAAPLAPPDASGSATPRAIAHYAAQGEGLAVSTGAASVREFVERRSAERRVIGLRDHYEWWNSNGEVGSAGKLLVLSPPDGPYHVFIDDHIHHDEPFIVDARAPDGSPLPFDAVQHSHLVRADPRRAILEQNYFGDLLDAALARASA